jgi:hypothetical protein
MRTIMRNAVLVAGAALFCATGTARASTTTLMQANVAFPFVVHGQVFPAGAYLVQRDDASPSLLLIRGEGSNHKATFVPVMRDSGRDPAGWKPALTFTQHDNQYRLTGVWQSRGDGWDVVGR